MNHFFLSICGLDEPWNIKMKLEFHLFKMKYILRFVLDLGLLFLVHNVFIESDSENTRTMRNGIFVRQ